MDKIALGKSGEFMASSYLQAKGHEILERGYRTKVGEIDIISLHEGTIHFVEVKTRSDTIFGLPREAVTAEKIKHITNTAEIYIKNLNHNLKNCGCCNFDFNYSIDVIEVMVNHIEGVV